jgi:coenzyme F420 biosynthesis associated uncharacterized protein
VDSSSRLVDWEAAAGIGRRFAGPGPQVAPAERGRLAEDFDEVVTEAEALVTEFTGLRIDGPPSRPWVMTRREWIEQNLRGFEQILEPVATRLLGRRLEGALAPVRRQLLAFQVGGILGYLGRKVLGQYDLFLPPDDRDLIYFVGPNVVELERKHRFGRRDFRLWLALHEVTHRVQFEGVPWLRGYIGELMRSYLDTLDLDARRLLERLRRVRDEVRDGGVAWREMGILFALMTPEQRETFRRMQALMSLLEGHGNYVMDRVGQGRVRGARRMRRTLRERRRQGFNRTMQRAVGLDVKVRQYDAGERFVAEAVERVGPEGFARVWEHAGNLPTLEEVGRPDAWVERVATR